MASSGRFNTDSMTGQVLCVELWLPNGFTPSPFFIRPSQCQRKSWASFCVANMHFKRGMIGKYHATLTGPPPLPFLPLIFTGSFPSSALSPPYFILLYRLNPHLGQSSRSSYSQ
ncbi:hypothetical protein PVAP13_9KG325632 [Panicum virgatum]|uniref:Uncharacterized protein n=1 Tax=Panicum virgatum TaxID=38727 RepID=A0A8T0NTT1_PANVG|nr:hypothetical protein PVAP13_9KG325632 [Panicum virgatum]